MNARLARKLRRSATTCFPTGMDFKKMRYDGAQRIVQDVPKVPDAPGEKIEYKYKIVGSVRMIDPGCAKYLYKKLKREAH